MPSRRAVFQWLAKYPEFAWLYAAVRHDQIEGLAGEAVEIADSEPNIDRARLMIDARFAWIGKLRLKKY